MIDIGLLPVKIAEKLTVLQASANNPFSELFAVKAELPFVDMVSDGVVVFVYVDELESTTRVRGGITDHCSVIVHVCRKVTKTESMYQSHVPIVNQIRHVLYGMMIDGASDSRNLMNATLRIVNTNVRVREICNNEMVRKCRVLVSTLDTEWDEK